MEQFRKLPEACQVMQDSTQKDYVGCILTVPVVDRVRKHCTAKLTQVLGSWSFASCQGTSADALSVQA
jgi:hypothetical protein